MSEENAAVVAPPVVAPSIMATPPEATEPEVHQPKTKVLKISAGTTTDKPSGRVAKPTTLKTSTTQQAVPPSTPALETSNNAWKPTKDRAATSLKTTNVPTQNDEPIYLTNGEILDPKLVVFGNLDDREESTDSVADDWEAEFDATTKPSAPALASYMIKPHARTTVATPVAKVKKPKPVWTHTIEKGSVLKGAVGTSVKNASGKKANRNRMGEMKSRDDDYDDFEGGTQDMYAAMGGDYSRGRARTGWQEVKRPGF